MRYGPTLMTAPLSIFWQSAIKLFIACIKIHTNCIISYWFAVVGKSKGTKIQTSIWWHICFWEIQKSINFLTEKSPKKIISNKKIFASIFGWTIIEIFGTQKGQQCGGQLKSRCYFGHHINIALDLFHLIN